MLLLIDNYDSFTYNIVQYFQVLGQEVKVKRNDEITCSEILQVNPHYLVIGPGPCTPKQAGISMECVCQLMGKIPILGICLGHQVIAEALGGRTTTAKVLMHGKNSAIYHNNQGVFQGIVNPVSVTRYHSLVTERKVLPTCLEITAWTKEGEIMGIKHQRLALEGIQFHPEALFSEQGYEMFNNFLVQHQISI